MTQPLAVILYDQLLPGSQLVNRLQDLNYRVQVVTDPEALVNSVETAGPMLVMADLNSSRADVCAILARLKANPASQHLPIVAFADEVTVEIEARARAAGATLVASDAAILSHLPQLLQQVLQVD